MNLEYKPNKRIRNLNLPFSMVRHLPDEYLHQYFSDLINLYLLFDDEDLNTIKPKHWKQYSLEEIIDSIDKLLNQREQERQVRADASTAQWERDV